LHDFLIKTAKAAGIGVFEDDISSVNLDEEGNISTLTGGKKEYSYDFYIDSTGFKKLLIGKLGAKWQSYGKYLKMKSAITFQTSDTDEYDMWTVARAMDYGWLFRIPVWGRHGNGYIFDSDYISTEKAKAEVEKLYGGEITIGKEFKFDPGCVDRAWIKNCCAIGLSSSFVEPLEASSIGTSIQQAFLLMHKIAAYDEHVINSYNKSFTSIMDNIRDFVVLQYVTNKTNTQFWKDVAQLELPDSLQTNLDMWRNKLPIGEDFSMISDYALFTQDNFTVVMDGLNLFNRDSIRLEYERTYSHVKKEAEDVIKQQLKTDCTIDTFSHKEFISLVRNHL